MKKVMATTLKFILFFLGWSLASAFLPSPNNDNQSIWRLWAEITPLLAIIIFAAIFWLVKRKTLELIFFINPAKGLLVGAIILGGVSLADNYPHMLNTTFSESMLLSGGACKIEGSVIALILNILLMLYFFLRIKKSKV